MKVRANDVSIIPRISNARERFLPENQGGCAVSATEEGAYIVLPIGLYSRKTHVRQIYATIPGNTVHIWREGW